MDDKGLCPTGWKVPHDSDWVNLVNFLGGESVAGDKLKSLDLWYGPGTPATDEIGFTAKPGSKKDIATALKKLRKRAGFDAKKYLGIIKLNEDPLAIQKRMRNAWE